MTKLYYQEGVPKELQLIITNMVENPELEACGTIKGILDQYKSISKTGEPGQLFYWDGIKTVRTTVEGLTSTKEPSLYVQLLIAYLKAEFPNKKIEYVYEHEFKKGDALIKTKEYKIDGCSPAKIKSLLQSHISYIAINSISLDIEYYKEGESSFKISNKPLEVIKPVITVRMAQL